MFFLNDSKTNIFEFHVPPHDSTEPKQQRSGFENDTIMAIEVPLRRVGKIPAPNTMFTNGHMYSEVFDDSFPAFITAGDISEDGTQIILRGKDGKNL